MDLFRVSYQVNSPAQDSTEYEAYVLASGFDDAKRKLEKRIEKDFESASISMIEKLDSLLII